MTGVCLTIFVGAMLQVENIQTLLRCASNLWPDCNHGDSVCIYGTVYAD